MRAQRSRVTRKNLFLLLLLCYLLLLKNDARSGIQCGSFDECFDFGMQTYDMKNYDASISLFKRALSEWTEYDGGENYRITKENLSAAYNNRGLQKTNKGKINSAIADFTSSTKVLPGFAPAYYNRGLAYSHKGDRKKAIENYTKVVKLDPKATIAYYNRGLEYYYTSQFNKAIADFTRAIKLEPAFIYAYNNRGISYTGAGKYDKAIVEFTKLIKYYPYDADFYNNRALAYFYKNNFDKAIADFTKALDLDSSKASAYFYRGLSYRQNDEYEAALDDFTKIIEMTESGEANIRAAYLQRGLTHTVMGNFDGALADFYQVIKLNPDFSMAYDFLGDIYFMAGEIQNAEENYKKAISGTHGKNPVPYMSLGELEYFKGNTQGALEYCKKAERLFRKMLVKNKSAELKSFLGYDLALMGRNLNEADKLIKEAVNAHPLTESFSRVVSGVIFYKMKRYDDAVEQLVMALRLSSPDEKFMRSDIYHRLALVYKDKGNLQKAKEYAEFSLSLIPTNPEARKLYEELQQTEL